MKWKAILALSILFLAIVSTTGCMEVSSQTKSVENTIAGVSITEHMYLWGDDGPLTRNYDISITALGVNVLSAKGVSYDQMEEIRQNYKEYM